MTDSEWQHYLLVLRVRKHWAEICPRFRPVLATLALQWTLRRFQPSRG